MQGVSLPDTKPTFLPLLQRCGCSLHFLGRRESRLEGGRPAREGSCGASLLPSPGEMDQDYERRLLRQINHQNLPAEARLSKVRHHQHGRQSGSVSQ